MGLPGGWGQLGELLLWRERLYFSSPLPTFLLARHTCSLSTHCVSSVMPSELPGESDLVMALRASTVEEKTGHVDEHPRP